MKLSKNVVNTSKACVDENIMSVHCVVGINEVFPHREQALNHNAAMSGRFTHPQRFDE